MIDIILCGDRGDTSVSDALVSTLALYGGVRGCGPDRLFERGVSAEFFLYECENLPKIELQQGIILFKNSIRQQHAEKIPENFLCILETKNTHAAAMLKDTGTAAVTCGTSTKDTLSVAALDGSVAVLSLQRSIRTLAGEIVEPRDFSVKCSAERSPHQLLSVSAVLLLSGIDSSVGYII